MSLREKAAELLTGLESKAEDLIDDNGDEWLSKLLEEGRDLADEELDGDLKEGANAALDVLGANTQPFVRMGKVGFAWVVGHYGSGSVDKAQLLYLEKQATFEERQQAMQDAGDAAVAERDERQASWDAAMAVFQKVGEAGLKFIVKLVIARLGL